MGEAPGLVLFGHPFSSFTWKAQIALHANALPYTLREFDPGDAEQRAWLDAVHPGGKFPVLLDGERVVVEAGAIIEHIALHHPGAAPLIPADPEAAATARMLERVFDLYVMAIMQRVVNAHIARPGDPDPAELAAGRDGLHRAYRWLEGWLAGNALPAHVSIVSCAAAPALFYADWVEPIPLACPRLAALRAELLALEPVVRCVEAARPFRPYFPPGAPDRD